MGIEIHSFIPMLYNQGYIFPSKIETIPQCSQNFQNFSDILKLDYMHEGFSLLEILSDNSSF